MNDKRAIEWTPEQLRKLQLELLDILLEFDRVCKENDIRYFLSSGTLIGALRHKGFIPWDDDVDVDMLREDYDKFCEIAPKELKEKFFLQTTDTDPEYRWTYGKVRKNDTKYIRVGQSHISQKTGLCIDLIPLDNLPNNEFGQRILEFGCMFCRKVLWSIVGKYQLNGLAKYLFYFISLIPRNVALQCHKLLATMFQGSKKKYISSYNTDVRTQYGYAWKREWFLDTVQVEFEGHLFPAPIGYHDLLYALYGNYMELPPEDQRCGSCPASLVQFSDGEIISSGEEK